MRVHWVYGSLTVDHGLSKLSKKRAGKQEYESSASDRINNGLLATVTKEVVKGFEVEQNDKTPNSRKEVHTFKCKWQNKLEMMRKDRIFASFSLGNLLLVAEPLLEILRTAFSLLKSV